MPTVALENPAVIVLAAGWPALSIGIGGLDTSHRDELIAIRDNLVRRLKRLQVAADYSDAGRSESLNALRDSLIKNIADLNEMIADPAALGGEPWGVWSW